MPAKEKINPKIMKEKNKKLIMRYLIENGPRSRPKIVEGTHLAASAVWRIMNELIEEGFVEEKGVDRSSKRKAIVYGPSKTFVTSLIFNVEILETTVGVGFLDGSWRVIDVFPTPKRFEDFVEKVFQTVDRENDDRIFRPDRTRVVFSLPGMVDSDGGVLKYAPNLNWFDVDFRDRFKPLEILVENDSVLSLLAEAFFTEDIKASSAAFFLYLGEGVGGSLMIDGRIVKGKNFAAGEIGHTVLYEDSLTRVEDLLSVFKLLRKVEERVELGEDHLGGKMSRIIQLWNLGEDEWVSSVMEEFLGHIAVTLRNVLYFLNPGIIVLGGAVHDIWERCGHEIQRRLEELVDPFVLEGVKIRDTIFKDVPPSLPGANVLAIESILEEM